MEPRFHWGARRGLHRQVIPDSLPDCSSRLLCRRRKGRCAADKDVCSVVLEVPNSALGTRELRLWARTLTRGDGGWIQVERGARPAQAVILVEERDTYLAGEPADDGRFLNAFAHALERTGGYSPTEAKRVAGTLLPDVLPYDLRARRLSPITAG